MSSLFFPTFGLPGSGAAQAFLGEGGCARDAQAQLQPFSAAQSCNVIGSVELSGAGAVLAAYPWENLSMFSRLCCLTT